MKFRKKPVVIEAVQWDGTQAGCERVKEAFPQLQTLAKGGWVDRPEVSHWKIGTLEGGHEVTPGDWIIQGVKGELYPCKPDIFTATYESAEAQPQDQDQRDSAPARDVLAERRRQIEQEGWTPEHDDEHDRGELADAAACYAWDGESPTPPLRWPWRDEWWKPKGRRSALVRAGALILAEIERLDRAAKHGRSHAERPDGPESEPGQEQEGKA